MILRTFFAAVTLVFAGSTLQASLLEWDQTEATVDMAPDDKEARASFVMTNRSDEPVRIDRIKTSCGCTGSVIKRKLVPPGESTEIVATFHRGKRRGGVNTNRLEVFLEGHPKPVATLRLVAHIPVLVDPQPRVVYWNPGAQPSPRTVRIKLDTRYVQQVDSIEFDASLFEVSRENDPADDSVLILTVQPLDFGTALRGEIKLSVSGADGRKETTRIFAYVRT